MCTYSAAVGKPEQKIVKAVEEHKKKKARQVQLDDPSTLSTDLRGTSVGSRCYSFADSPSSQQAEVQVDDLGSFYGNSFPHA